MDRAPPKLPNTASRLIAMAATLVGDADSVRQAMQCSHEDFRAYCAGGKEPTMVEFDRLIALIIREQGKLIERNRELLDKTRSGRKSR